MTSLRLGRAVVLGVGMAGIAAAAALRHASAEVVLVERDALPTRPEPRPGVPQGEQLHNLLGRAQLHLDALLPGFCSELCAAGAGVAHVAEETHVFEMGARMPRRDLGLALICAPRPLIEHVARARLLRERRVVIRDRTRAVDIDIDADRAVRGVVLERDGVHETMPTTIVIDATGGRSTLTQSLRERGCATPPVETARVSQWYASARVARPSAHRASDACWMTFPTPPATRGGLVAPSTPTEWSVSVSGRAADVPPTDADAFRAYAATLEDERIANLLEGTHLLAAPRVYRKPTMRWRRWDRLADPPVGLLPLGDSVASLNPLFGQGISVAAWQAAALAELIADGQGAGRPTTPLELTIAFHRRAAAAVDAAWQLGDLVERPAFHPDVLLRAIEGDAALHRLYVSVWHLLAPVARLEQALAVNPVEAIAG